jgi:nitrous oxidase accessory protein
VCKKSRLQADRVHHFAEVGRVQAWDDVEVFEKADSMRIVGDTLRLLQANRFREEDRLSVWGDETYAVMRFEGGEDAGADSVPAPSDSLPEPPAAAQGRDQARDTVYAQRIHLRGRSRFAASGAVRIVSGEVVARSDSADYARQRGVLYLLPAGPVRDLFHVGRLDFLSEGLLLLTNDGELKRRLELPSTGWLRRYRVRVFGTVDEAALDALKAGVTVEGVLVHNSGWSADDEDTGVFIDGNRTTLRDLRVTNVTFGVWVDGVDDVTVENATMAGHPGVSSHAQRGNGIHLWKTEDVVLRGNDVTQVRDGIYFSWAEHVEAVDNRLWDLRYGVHYMYSNDNRLADNLAFGNDVGYALMVSQDLTIVNNTAVNNTGRSGHGLMVKSIDDSTISGNHLVGNDKGLFMYNSLHNELSFNLVLANAVAVHLTAGSNDETVHHNTFVDNGKSIRTDLGEQVVWNESAGNYWADATVRDVDGDGISEIRHRPAGLVDQLTRENPLVAVFARSPAVGVIELAESRVPLVEAPGVVDRRPLASPVPDRREYHDRE